MDFTLPPYTQLLITLQSHGYIFLTLEQYLKSAAWDFKLNRFVILRHDVDKLPQNSLAFAKIQHSMGIKGTYYFRAVPCSWNENIIKEIAALGHEVGYHYENLTTCKGDMEKAYDNFRYNLDRLRKLVPVSTICMHGSPRSPFDSKDLWKRYNYKNLGLIGEPYFDTDFSKVFYITDTGRCWDGYKVSVRDKVEKYQAIWQEQGLVYHSTDDIIQAIENGSFPQQVMFTMHPQRWTNNRIAWFKEFLLQNLKNQIKKRFIS